MAFSASIIFRGVDQMSAPVKRMQAQAQAFASSAQMSFGKVATTTSMLAGKLELASKKMLSFKSVMMGAVIFTAGKQLYNMAMGAMNTQVEYDRLSKRLGMTVQGFKELNYAAGYAGVSTEAFSKAMARFSNGLGMARMNSGKLYSFLKVNDRGLLSNLQNAKSTEDAFMAFANSVSHVKDRTKQAAMVQMAFGRNAQGVQNLLMGGAKSIEKLREEYRKYVGTSSASVEQYKKMFEANRRFTASFAGLKNSIAIGAVPVMTELIDKMSSWIAVNKDFIKSNIKVYVTMFGKAVGFLLNNMNIIMPIITTYLAATVALKVATVGLNTVTLIAKVAQFGFAAATAFSAAMGWTSVAAIEANNLAMGIYNGILGISTAAQWLFNSALYASPTTWVVAGIIALIAVIVLLVKYWKDIVGWVTNSNNVFAILIRASIMPIIMHFKTLVTIVEWVIDRISKLWEWFSNTKVFISFAADIKLAFSTVGVIINFVLDKITKVFGAVTRFVKMVAKPIWNQIKIASSTSQKELQSSGISGTEKPVNIEKTVQTQRKIQETNSSQNVRIDINDNTGGRTQVSGNLSPIPIKVNSTRGL